MIIDEHENLVKSAKARQKNIEGVMPLSSKAITQC